MKIRMSMLGSVALASVLFASSAFAGLITDTKYVFEKLDEEEKKGITHEVSIPSGEEVYWAGVVLLFADDSWYDYREVALGKVAGEHWFKSEINELTVKVIELGEIALAMLNTTGKVDVKIKSLKGDFWWKTSTLIAKTREVPVPEPGTLALLGAGLLGLGFARRRTAH